MKIEPLFSFVTCESITRILFISDVLYLLVQSLIDLCGIRPAVVLLHRTFLHTFPGILLVEVYLL